VDTTRTRFLVGLFILSCCIRVLAYHCYLSKNENFWQVDSFTYHRIAQGISEGKGISQPTGQPNFYRLPGYPIFIASLYKIFGQNPEKVLWFQVILGALIPLLIFFLSLVLFPNVLLLAQCASVYSAFHLGLVLYSGFFMTETLFLILFLFFSIFFFKRVHLWFCSTQEQLLPAFTTPSSHMPFIPEPLDQTPSFTQMYGQLHEHSHDEAVAYVHGDQVFKGLALAGIFLGLASMVRPVGHYLVALSLLTLLFSNDGWRQFFKKSFTFFIPWLLVVTPWLLRNYLLLGHVFFHTLPGGHFLYLSASRVAMNAYDISYQDARQRLGTEVAEVMHDQQKVLGHPLNEIEKCYAHEQVAKKYFRSYPLITLKVWITDMLRTCLSLYSAELLYLESGRKEINYFDQGRSVWSVFARYLFPPVDSVALKIVVWLEIIFFLFILLGFFGGLVNLVTMICGYNAVAEVACSWLKVLPYMGLFIVIALAGGYARMRLPIEPFLIIFAWCFYLRGNRRYGTEFSQQ
jgi:4-amino-4-deoxy-L-arabinose transferase-like glycosyltransferase